MLRVEDIRESTLEAISGLFADGKTALYEAVALGLQELDALRANNSMGGVDPMTYALVVRPVHESL